MSLLIDDHYRDFHGHGEQNGLSLASGISNGRRVLAFTAVAVLRFCMLGLIVSLAARSRLAYRAHRVAISLALRGKARRAAYRRIAHLRAEIVSGRRDAGKHGNNL